MWNFYFGILERMRDDKLLHFSLGVLLIIVVLQAAAFSYSLYYLYPWYDIMMHFLGGIFVALLLVWFVFYSRYLHVIKKTWKNVILVALFGTLLVGIGWEVFEYLLDIIPEEGYREDTTIDLIMDLLGALVVTPFLYTKNPS